MKRLKILGITLGLSLFMLCPAVSAEPISLDDVGKAQQTQTQVQQSTGSSLFTSEAAKESTQFMKDLEQSSDLSEGKETAQKVAAPLKNMVAIVVQILAYVITIGLSLRVVLDLSYIALPFARTFLGNGFTGSAQNATQQPMMGGGMPGAMGGSSGFGLGFGSSYQAGRNLGQQVGMSAQNSMSNQVNTNGRIQWISSAALNAVASEGTLGADGRQISAYKIYMKDMMVILILTPVLLVLAITGTLTELGFLVGNAVSNMIQGASSML